MQFSLKLVQFVPTLNPVWEGKVCQMWAGKCLARGLAVGILAAHGPVHREPAIVARMAYSRMNRPMAMRGFISTEILVLVGSAGINGTAGGNLHQPGLGFLLG